MAINFPNSPVLNDTYTVGDKIWTWNGTGWTQNPQLLSKSPVVSTPSYSATVSTSITGYDVIRITLTGNIQLGFTGGVDGQKFIVELTQDGVGSRTLTWDSSVAFGTDITATTLTTTASKTDRIGLIYKQSASKYYVIAFAKGY